MLDKLGILIAVTAFAPFVLLALGFELRVWPIYTQRVAVEQFGRI